jgi:hypothetical protein
LLRDRLAVKNSGPEVGRLPAAVAEHFNLRDTKIQLAALVCPV